MEETPIGSGLELRVVPNALLLIPGGDIPGLVAVTPASEAAAKSAYAITDLGTGGATGINDVGQIVGNSQGAFVISGGTRTTLPDLSSSWGGGFSSATGINNNHQIAEAPDTDRGYSHVLMWSNGTITDLGTLGGTQSGAYAINDNGQMTG
jgi:probable HAF family extracellular repeat protein